MIEQVLVTVRDESGRFEADLELPANEPMQTLAPLLADCLGMLAPTLYHGCGSVELCAQGGPLGAADTLAMHGLWDGSILTVRRTS